jgi:perosamine synthetase
VTPSRIPLIEPCLSGREVEYVAECLATGWVSSAGSYVERFEAMVAEALGCRHAVATSSGTAALHLALIVAGVQPDDEVLVSDLTFVAPANAVKYVGAWPVFVDAEPVYWQMDVSLIERFLSERCRRSNGATINTETGRRVSAIIPVHVLGHPVEMKPLLAVAERYGLAVVEDATESLGARDAGRRLGAIGTVGCLSFNGNKLLTTGGGGMLVTDDETLAQRARYLSTQAKDDPIRYVHEEIGFNYRLSNVHAAIGVGQMEQLDGFLASKHRIAARYQQGLSGIAELQLPKCRPAADSSWWMYSILIEPSASPHGRSNMGLMRALEAEGIQSRPLWQPLHLNRPYRAATLLGGGVAAELYARALSIPSSVQLSDADQERVIEAVRRYVASTD